MLVVGTIEEKDGHRIWISTQDPIGKNDLFQPYLMFTYYQQKVLTTQQYHLIDGPILDSMHDLEIIELEPMDFDLTLGALNQKYPIETEEGSDDDDSEEGSDEDLDDDGEDSVESSELGTQKKVRFLKRKF